MNDRFRFRQEIKPAFQKFDGAWHYWGYIDGGFTSPMGENTGGKSYQCTGLKDKNGVLIYEGDILDDGKNGTALIQYHIPTAMFLAFKLNGENFYLNEGDVFREPKLQYTEVIGNIYENQDLIQK